MTKSWLASGIGSSRSVLKSETMSGAVNSPSTARCGNNSWLCSGCQRSTNATSTPGSVKANGWCPGPSSMPAPSRCRATNCRGVVGRGRPAGGAVAGACVTVWSPWSPCPMRFNLIPAYVQTGGKATEDRESISARHADPGQDPQGFDPVAPRELLPLVAPSGPVVDGDLEGPYAPPQELGGDLGLDAEAFLAQVE